MKEIRNTEFNNLVNFSSAQTSSDYSSVVCENSSNPLSYASISEKYPIVNNRIISEEAEINIKE